MTCLSPVQESLQTVQIITILCLDHHHSHRSHHYSHQLLWNVHQCRNSRKFVSPATLEFPYIPRRSIRQSRISLTSFSPATLEFPSVLQLRTICQSWNSGTSVSPATLECLSVAQLWIVTALRLWNVCQSVSPECLGRTHRCPVSGTC